MAWTQRLDELSLVVTARDTCARLLHRPVIEVEETIRRADGALAWEWGLGSILTTVGIIGFSRPEWVSSSVASPEGGTRKDESTGYRLAGTFGAIGVLLLTAAIWDTVRARDTVHYRRVQRPEDGATEPCAVPEHPAAGVRVVLVAGDGELAGITDAEGKVTLRLPPEERLGTFAAEPSRVRVGLRVGARALGLELAVPYGTTAQAPSSGEGTMAPAPLGAPRREGPAAPGKPTSPPRPRP